MSWFDARAAENSQTRNTETTEVAQLRAIPNACMKQGRCGISAAPLKFATKIHILKAASSS